jgi:hypothetical protein
MGLINLEPTLHPGEEVRWRQPAAHSLEDRTVAGVLYATSDGLVFMPNRLNRRRYLVSTRIPGAQIASVDTAGPVRSVSARKNGGLRRRLRVTVHDGEPELFVINHPERVARELRRLLVP